MAPRSRTVSWNDDEFGISGYGSPFPPTGVTLKVKTKVGGIIGHDSVTLAMEEWRQLAEYILSLPEPVIWYVSVKPTSEIKVERSVLQGNRVPGNGLIRSYDSGEFTFYLRANSETDALAQAGAIAHDYKRLAERLAR